VGGVGQAVWHSRSAEHAPHVSPPLLDPLLDPLPELLPEELPLLLPLPEPLLPPLPEPELEPPELEPPEPEPAPPSPPASPLPSTAFEPPHAHARTTPQARTAATELRTSFTAAECYAPVAEFLPRGTPRHFVAGADEGCGMGERCSTVAAFPLSGR
jgi:hypothetical protein